jgi:hypothetical protein
MPEKREQIEIGQMESRKTRVTRSGLDCSNPNPDRGIHPPVETPIDSWRDTGDLDVTEYLPLIVRGYLPGIKVSPLGEIPAHIDWE